MAMEKDARIFVAGHRGLVGSALLRQLESRGYRRLITRARTELDLADPDAVEEFFAEQKPDYVFLAAARVGGIWANETRPADFIRDNLAIELNVIHQSFVSGVKRLLFLGSSCIYPRQASQPMKESAFMTGPLELTNSPYAVAKIAGVEMCWAYNRQHRTCFIPVMPTNLYGPGDNFDLLDSHVLPALIRKFHLAKLAASGHWPAVAADERCFGQIPEDVKNRLESAERTASAAPVLPQVVLWGTGNVRREFLYVDDLAAACVHLMNTEFRELTKDTEYRAGERPFLFNIGTGRDLTIKDLARRVAAVVGFEGDIVWDSSKPDGTARKLLDVSRISALGWRPVTDLEEGIAKTYSWYLSRLESGGR